MPCYVALLRSIVIAGRRVSMAPVRGWAAAAETSDIATVGATGNLVFRSRRGAPALTAALEAACAADYGRATEIVVKTAAEWRALVAANPFAAEAAEAPANLLVYVMREPLPNAGLAQLERRARPPERLHRTPAGDLYIWFGPEPDPASKIPSGFTLKALGAIGTSRNWNSVQRITAALY